MTAAASPGGGGASPQPMNPNAPALGTHHLSSEMFVDGFDGMEEELAAAEPEPAPKPRAKRATPGELEAERKQAKAKPAPEESIEEEQPLEEQPEESAAADEEAETEQDAPLLPAGKGSREQPLTIKDLPKDKFIEVKVDGQKMVVDLAEALDGTFMRPAYLHKALNTAKLELGKAKEIASNAVQSQERFQQDWSRLLGSPEALLGYFLDSADSEAVFEQVAMGYFKIRKAERDNPELHLRRVRARDQREIDRRRKELDAREETDRTTRANQQRIQQIQERWKPGIEAGMRAAGFPEMTDELREEVEIRLARVKRKNGTVTAEDWEAAIPAAAKAIGAKPANARERRPAPPPPPATPPTRPRSNGKKDWSTVPETQRLRDPSFYFRD
ncbi:MAG TPA: hypothetical protein VED01_21390 [Burkholderiales bacterium]|nr:hypothetical protein [Burkholderiales bacterium]